MNRQVTVYMNEDDRQRIDELLILYAAEGSLEILDSRGNPSMAALVRMLIKRDLEEMKATPA